MTNAQPVLVKKNSTTGEVPKFESSSTLPWDYINDNAIKYNEVVKRISELEVIALNGKKYLSSSAFLNKLVSIIVIVTPILFISMAAILLAILRPSELITKFLYWVVGIIGVSTVLDLIIIPTKINLLSQRLDNIERELDK